MKDVAVKALYIRTQDIYFWVFIKDERFCYLNNDTKIAYPVNSTILVQHVFPLHLKLYFVFVCD